MKKNNISIQYTHGGDIARCFLKQKQKYLFLHFLPVLHPEWLFYQKRVKKSIFRRMVKINRSSAIFLFIIMWYNIR